MTAARRSARAAVSLVAAIALGAAAAFAIAAALRSESPRALVQSPLAPLRVASGRGIATGFAVADGRVVTVAHVLDGPVMLRGRRVRVLQVDRANDLALLAAPADVRAPRSTAPVADHVADGEHLRVVRIRAGAPSVLSVEVRRSIVAHVRPAGARRAFARPALELSGRAAPGDSGAAVITDAGALAGVVFAASRNRPNTAYAVDARAVTQLLGRR